MHTTYVTIVSYVAGWLFSHLKLKLLSSYDQHTVQYKLVRCQGISEQYDFDTPDCLYVGMADADV